MRRGVVYALSAAALFGASTPFAKALLAFVDPIVLAGLLYAGSGVGLAVVQVVRVSLMRGRSERITWPLRKDWWWLTAAILCGGVAGPVLLMLGLATISGTAASLLLNLESAFTALLAWFVFRENFDRRIAVGMVAIVAGGVVLTVGPGHAGGVSPGALLIVAACFCWAVDNNLTRKVSASDAIHVAGLKGLAAAAVNLSIALTLGLPIPGVDLVAKAAVLGFFGYGLSLVLFVLALRHLGTARTGAYFAVAPFVGALLAVVFFGDVLNIQLWIAGTLMTAGLWLHLTERHEHEHTHEVLRHGHGHRHDAHHQHAHSFPWDGTEPHTHEHLHEPIVHVHPHYPDVHHRHPH
jgi:drug/metabolite transporter (DMT)-like permease